LKLTVVLPVVHPVLQLVQPTDLQDYFLLILKEYFKVLKPSYDKMSIDAKNWLKFIFLQSDGTTVDVMQDE